MESSEYTGLAQAYQLSEPRVDGAEGFSLVRESQLAPADYLNTLLDTGSERQQHA